MTQNKEDLKNKIIYRASYRGAKEIDILLTSFVKKYINSLKNEDLIDLCNFLSVDDENIFNFYRGTQTTVKIPKNYITDQFRSFKIKK
tara:strand:- start:12 stop:275 length:264 start_codon:yes stop_codon:yes gene_type:complete